MAPSSSVDWRTRAAVWWMESVARGLRQDGLIIGRAFKFVVVLVVVPAAATNGKTSRWKEEQLEWSARRLLRWEQSEGSDKIVGVHVECA